MPFPKLQPMPLASASGSTSLLHSTYDEDTGRETITSSNFHEDLAPAKMFDLDYMLKNKIPLEETNSKILGTEKLTIKFKPKATETTETTETTEEKGE